MRGRTTLHGRDAEVGRLSRVLEDLGKGIGSTVVIEGDAGIGKSRLVEVLADDARAARFEVYIGRTSEIERTHPLVGVADALGPLRADLPGALWGEEDGPRGLRLYEAAVDELERRSMRRPVVLCLEDIHWADPDTLQFVRTAARRTLVAPLGVVLTTRPVEGSPEVAHVIDRLSAEGADVVAPAGLTPDAVAAVVADAIGVVPGPRLLGEVARADGNPFYVLELVAAMAEQDALIVDGEIDARTASLPRSFRLVVLRRLATLPTDTLDDLRVAAILGRTFSIEDLSIVAERSAIELMRTLGPARAAGFLEERNGQLSFTHDLVRSTLYEDIPQAIRRSIHARIGRSLSDAGRPAVAVASHVAIGAEPGDADAVDMLVQATIDVAHVSFDAMLVYLEHAVRLCARDHPRFIDIATQLVSVLLNVGRLSEAEMRARELLSTELSADDRAFTVSYLAEALTARGSLDEAAALNNLMASDPELDAEKRAIALADLAKLALLRGDLTEVERLSSLAESADRSETFPIGRLGAMFARCLLADAGGLVTRALELGADVANLEDTAYASGQAIPTTRTATGLALAASDRPRDALEQLGRSAQRLDEAGSVLSNNLQHVSCWIRYWSGEWDSALADAEITVALDAGDRFDAGYANEFALLAFAVTARVLLHRDDLDGAREIVARGQRWIDAGVARLDAGAFEWTRALLLEACGDHAAALDLMAQTWLTGVHHRFLGGVWRFLAPDLARFALEAKRHDLAAAIADDVAPQLDQSGSASFAAMRVRALVAGDGEALHTATRGLHDAGRRVEAAGATVEAAIALGRSSSSVSAGLFREALACFEELGATRSVRRTNALMRTFGVRSGVRGKRSRPKTGWEALTSTEQQVVALVGEGMTNGAIAERLFISPRTVQTHLRNVFGKLGASSRAEVAAEAVRRVISNA